jgi:hypothetical protein
MKKNSKEIKQLVREGRVCPYCWGETEYRDGLYVPFLSKMDRGFVFVCEKCKAFAPETSPKSEQSDGRLYTPLERRLLEEVVELWNILPRYRSTKWYFMRRKYGAILKVEDPPTMQVNQLTPKQLKELRDLLRIAIAKCETEGREYRSKGLRKLRMVLNPGWVNGPIED